jgi:hypothetical protein
VALANDPQLKPFRLYAKVASRGIIEAHSGSSEKHVFGPPSGGNCLTPLEQSISFLTCWVMA